MTAPRHFSKVLFPEPDGTNQSDHFTWCNRHIYVCRGVDRRIAFAIAFAGTLDVNRNLSP